MHELNSFDSLFDKIMSNYNVSTVNKNKSNVSQYSLEDDSMTIEDDDVECVEDENSELYDIGMDIEDEDGEKSIDVGFDELEDNDMLTEADDDPFAETPTDEQTAPADDATPEAEPPQDDAAKEDTTNEDEPATEEESDKASYNVKLDLIISNISAALKTTINTAGSDLYDKIIIYGFEESIKVFVEDYLKKMVDGDIKINTIEKMDIISFAAPNIDQIVKKIIQNLAKK